MRGALKNNQNYSITQESQYAANGIVQFARKFPTVHGDNSTATFKCTRKLSNWKQITNYIEIQTKLTK